MSGLMRNNARETLLDLHRLHVRSWENRNFEEMRAVFADEAVVFGTEPPSKFSDFRTFENTLQQYFSQMSDVSFMTSNIQIEVYDPVAWVTSLYLWIYRLNGDEVRETGRWTEIYLERDGKWQLVHFHASRDPGLPGL